MAAEPTFGTWLKRKRKELDLTQNALAEKSGCSVDMVRRIEQGSARPSRQLAELLIASVDAPTTEHPALIQWARLGMLEAQSIPSGRAGGRMDNESSSVTASEHPGTPVIGNTLQLELHNPYKGLQPFDEADAEDFFGREGLTRRLVSRLGEVGELCRFLAVVGPSGSGKSSVVRAGLVPALRQGALQGSEQWSILEVLPGPHPFEELEAALLKIAINPPASLLPQLLEDERGLLRAVKRALPSTADTALLLILDQFEEVFTLVEDESMRRLFLDSICNIVTEARSPVRVVATLRADFYGHPLLYPRLGELVRQRTEVVLPMLGDELEQAITKPGERFGVSLESGLLAAIVQDVIEQPGALPLLQYAMTELFEHREGMVMTLRAYRESGGVSGSISGRAEALYGQLADHEQEITRQLFLRLMTPGDGAEDTRRRVRMSELLTSALDEAALHRVLDLFGQYRLLTFDRDPISGGPTIEVAHEALLTTWGRLRDWIEQYKDDLRIHRRIITATSEWLAASQDPSFLAPGVKLAQFEDLAGKEGIALNTNEHAYISASIAERKRQETVEEARRLAETALQRRAAGRMRYLVAALSLFFVIATGLSLFALNRQQEAEVSATRSEALRLAAQATTLLEGDSHIELAALLAVRSLSKQYTLQGDEALGGAYMRKFHDQQYAGLGGSVFTAVYSPDGTYLLLARDEKVAQIWDVGLRRRIRSFEGHNDSVLSAVFSRDGDFVLTGSFDKTARIWGATSGQLLHTLPNHADQVWDVAFSPDGHRALTSGGKDNTARLWDTASGIELGQLKGHFDIVNSVAFSPDGKMALTGSADKTARIWNLSTFQAVLALEGHEAPVWGVAFSPDGKLALTGRMDETARLWEVPTGKELRQLKGHQGPLGRVAFSPDGMYALTGSGDQTARLWDVSTGKQLRVFPGGTGGVNGVGFSPDGHTILVSGSSSGARLWPIDYHQTISTLCVGIARDLTTDERERYFINDGEATCPEQ
jgi:DNA-binding XRE family transcriptional regulator